MFLKAEYFTTSGNGQCVPNMHLHKSYVLMVNTLPGAEVVKVSSMETLRKENVFYFIRDVSYCH